MADGDRRLPRTYLEVGSFCPIPSIFAPASTRIRGAIVPAISGRWNGSTDLDSRAEGQIPRPAGPVDRFEMNLGIHGPPVAQRPSICLEQTL